MKRSIPQKSSGARATRFGLVAILVGVLIAYSAAAMNAHGGDKAISRDAAKPPASEHEVPAGDLYALVVGVSKHRSSLIPPLRFAAKDAVDFAKFLSSQKVLFRKLYVNVLTDEHATRQEVEKHLFYGLLKAGTDDTVIVYFSGHGAIDPKRGEEYFFVAHDTDPEYLAASAVMLSGPRFLGSLSARHTLVVADTCHAGWVSEIRTKSLPLVFQSFLQEFQQASGRVIIASSKPGEFSLEQEALRNSVFSHFFLKGVRGAADKDGDGVITVREAYEYAYDHTKDVTQGAQHPVFEGRLEGRFALAFVNLPKGTIELFTEPALADIYVRADSGFKPTAKTDAAGRAELTDLPINKPLIIMCKKPGWKNRILDPVLLTSSNARTTLSRIQLDPAQSFLVFNGHDAGVKLRIEDKDAGETGQDNLLVVDNVQVGVSHKITLSKAGFDDKVVTLTIPEAYEGRTFTWSDKLSLRRPTTIETLVVTDPPGVEVYLGEADGPVGVTGASGSLRVAVADTGKLAFRFIKENYEPKIVEYDISKDRARKLPKVVLTRTKSDLLVHTDPGRVSVSINGEQLGETDAGGQLLVKGVEVDKPLDMAFAKHGYVSLRKELKLPSSPLFRMPPARLNRLTGSLALSADPPSAEVSITDAAGFKFSSKTDAAGALTVSDLPVDTPLFVTIRKTGWNVFSAGPMTCSEGALKIRVPKISLERASASLLLTTESARVSVEMDGTLVGETGDDRTLRLDGLSVAVPHEITLRKNGFHEKKITVSIPVASAEKVHAPPLIHMDKVAKAQPPARPDQEDISRPPAPASQGASRGTARQQTGSPSEETASTVAGPSPDLSRSQRPGVPAEPSEPRPSGVSARQRAIARPDDVTPSPIRGDSVSSQAGASGTSARFRSMGRSGDAETYPTKGNPVQSAPETSGVSARQRAMGRPDSVDIPSTGE